MAHRLHKSIAGFHLLTLLSRVDGKFPREEGEIIVRYLRENFPFNIALEKEIEFLSALPAEKYAAHFEKAMNDFYEDSTESERDHFLDFAVKLVKADHTITKEENSYLGMLFTAWAPEFEEES